MNSTMIEPGAEPEGRVPAADGPDAPDPSHRSVRPLWRIAAVIGLLAFVVRVWAPGPVTQTVDEYAWYMCSRAFREAVVEGNLADASTSAITGPWMTQPGVTTMWAGTIGYGAVAVGERLGVVDDEAGTSRDDQARILRGGRVVVSLWCAIALVALIVVAARLIGRRAAVVAGVLLAAEPFLAGHSHVLHTDAMVTMFGALAIVSLAAALRDRASPPDRKLLVVAGVAAGLAALTKLNALPLLVTGAAVVLVFQTDWRRASIAASLRRSVLTGLAFVGVAAAVFYLLWPALWVNPWSELQRLPEGLDQLSRENYTFFRGRVTAEPGVLYYPVALALRMSPWLMVAAFAAVVAAVVHLVRRALGARAGDDTPWPAPSVLMLLLLAPVPYAVLIALTGQKYDRYALPVVPFLALIAGVGIAVAADRWSHRFGDRLLRPAGLAAAVAVTAVTVATQPYAISFANPLVGGQQRARTTILLGWGEGYEAIGAEIERREGGRCSDVEIHTSNGLADFISLPCGRNIPGADLGPGDYVVRYISTIQRTPNSRIDLDVMRRGRLLKKVDIGGVTYAELWQYPD
jgi:hypothetical protein